MFFYTKTHKSENDMKHLLTSTQPKYFFVNTPVLGHDGSIQEDDDEDNDAGYKHVREVGKHIKQDGTNTSNQIKATLVQV